MDTIRWLNQNAGAFSLLFSAVVTLATVVYAWLTWKLVGETRAMRRAQTEPSVSLRLAPHAYRFGFVDLVLCNDGVGAAYDVAFQVVAGDDADVELLKKLNELGFVKRGLAYMSPRQEIRTFFASAIQRDEQRMNTNIKVLTRYRSALGDKVEGEFWLDFSPFWGYGAVGEHPLVAIEKELEKIQKEVTSLGSGSKKLRVRTYTLEEETRADELSILYMKLNRLPAEAWEEVRQLVDERFKASDG